MKRMYFTVLLITMGIVVAAALFSACSDTDESRGDQRSADVGEEQAASDGNNDGGFSEADDSEQNSEDSDAAEAPENNDGSADAARNPDQMIIYSGNLTIEVNDYDEAENRIQSHVDNVNGYVVESSVYQAGEDEQRQGTLVVRVPQESFHSFLTDLESESTNVVEKSTSGNDVTEEYVDLEARLSSQETVEERLLAFLDDADSTEDLLTISQDLTSVQEEIERIKGQMNYLENHVAFSTVTVQIHEQAVNVAGLPDRETLNTFERTQSLFMDTVNFLITLLSRVFIGIVGLSPVLVPVAAAGGAVYFIRKKRKMSNESSD